MLKKILFKIWKESFLALVVLAVMAGTSWGAVYNLRADVTTKVIDGATIPMWGFADDTIVGPGNGTVTIPGPTLAVPVGESLVINLTNNLPVPVSIVIPGQSITPTPTYDGGRVMSFTAAAPAKVGTTPGTATYTWTNLKPGTYIYQSGTNPAVQVQMGLYGAVKKDFAAGQAYDSLNAGYINEVVLFFSAIDPVIHGHVAGGTYGTPIPAGITSTVDYWPRYFLINGEPYSGGSLAAGNVGQKTLIRFLNAGLQTYVPTLLGSHISIIAEDGNLLPYPKEQYSLILPAGKTTDAIFTPQLPGTYPVFDRRLNVTNAGVTPGGMIAKLSVAGAVSVPTVVNDDYKVAAGGTLIVAAPGVLGNDSGTGPLTAALVLGSGPNNGTLTLNANGSFSYTNTSTPVSGSDSFQYTANNAGGASVAATVTINVISNAAPVANDQAVTTNEDTAVAITLLATDANGDLLTYSIVASPMNGTLTGALPNVTYTPALNYFGADSFTFKANDGLVDSNVATVSITVNSVNDLPVANDDSASTAKNTPVIINLIANDTDIDGTINPASVVITTQPTRGGTVTNHLNGTVTFTPKNNFRGTDVFRYTVKDNAGATSNIATVRVNVK